MAAIKSYPYPIKSAKEAGAILGVGEKIASHCEEFVKTGKIAAAGEDKLITITTITFSSTEILSYLTKPNRNYQEK
jgi:hypothetical protein